ncbi:MAG: helix-turn-helix transcriptional regulator [Alphaproteobacteria bacterium]|nr:helix-turn-helix transcriptional regulator [Alphaproteobacteria bacterium]
MAKSALVRELERRMQAAGLNQKSLALKAGLNETAVRDIRIGRSRNPRTDTLKRLATALGVSVGVLSGHTPVAAARARPPVRGKSPRTLAPALKLRPERSSEFVYVPVYGVSAGAGHGMDFEPAGETSRLPFRREWLRQVTTAPVDQLALITVHGDSMAPTLIDGDTVLVDRSQRAVRRDGIFVIRHDGLLLVKRLQIDPGRGKVIVSCDNRDYPPLAPVDSKHIDVAGRVIWVGRRL